MLAIKFRRIGKKKQASYRIVVAEKRSKLGGRYVEDLGWFNPRNNQFDLKIDRVKYWIEQGVQPTESVAALFKKANL